MKWFEHHLNWTMVLACMGSCVGVSILVPVIWSQPNVLCPWVCLLPFCIPCVCGAWVLGRKSQCLRWVLVAWTPPGWFVPIALKNRRQVSFPVNCGRTVAHCAGDSSTVIDRREEPRRSRACNCLASLGAAFSVVCTVLGLLALAVSALCMQFALNYHDETVGGGGILLFLLAGYYGPAMLFSGGVISGGSAAMVLQNRSTRSSRRGRIGHAAMTVCAVMMALYVVAWTLFFVLSLK